MRDAGGRAAVAARQQGTVVPVWSRAARAALLVCLCATGLAQAQIKIGQTAGFSGPAAAGVQEITDGARLYFDAINAQGGIKGQSIELISLDDKYEPQLSAANAERLIEQGVVALFLSRGTAQSQALLPLLSKYQVALVAPSSGAMVLHQPFIPQVFNVRATFQREAARAVQHLATIGVKRVTVVQVNDAFGNDAGVGAIKGLEAQGMKASAILRFDRDKPELAPLMEQVAKAGVEAVLFIGPSYAVVQGVNALRATGSKAHIATLSNNASTDFVKALGENAHGVIVTQVFPYERSSNNPLVREALGLAKARGRNELSPAQIEGFAAAKLMVEGLKRSVKDVNRASLLKALEGVQRLDLGGVELHYGPKDRSGLDFVDISIIGPDGKFWR